MSTTDRGITRVLSKLEASVNAKNYYEAHQMYRTLFFRYNTQKKYKECLDLVYNGAINFLSKEQYALSSDLAILIVETLEKSNEENEKIWIDKLFQLICKTPSSIVERDVVIARVVKWSGDKTNSEIGNPLFHKLIATIFWKENNFEQARHHIMLSHDGIRYGQMLVKLSMTKGLASEIDLFIAQTVFQQLCLKHLEDATKTFETYVKYHPEIACNEPPFPYPLLNFIYFLLKIIDTKNWEAFRMLCDLYKTALSRDETYDKYLQKIGTTHFDVVLIKPQISPAMSGMFGNILNQIFQDMEDGPLDAGAGFSGGIGGQFFDFN